MAPKLKRRLRCKTPDATAAKVHKRAAKKPAAARTVLRAAVKGGVVPKARRAYTLFMKHQYAVEAENAPSVVAETAQDRHTRLLRKVSEAWKALPLAETEKWIQTSRGEATEQRAAVARLGLRVRWNARVQGVRPGGLACPSPPVEQGLACPSQALVSYTAATATYEVDASAKPLGAGSYGKVFWARQRETGQLFALKQYRGQGASPDMMAELSVYAALREVSPQHVGRHRFLTCTNHHVGAGVSWLVLPAHGDGLWRHLGTLTGNKMSGGSLRACVLQACQALDYLHHKGFLHLDVKPDNMLWRERDRDLRLVDFGLSVRYPVPLESDLTGAFCNRHYRPPELLHAVAGADLRPWISPQIDLWSLGCSIFDIAAGRVLFPDPTTDVRAYCAARRGERGVQAGVLARLSECPQPFQTLVWHLCRPTPERRLKLGKSCAGPAWFDAVRKMGMPTGPGAWAAAD